MTEAEWFAATSPTKMLEFIRGKASDRQLRLLLAETVASRTRLNPDDDPSIDLQTAFDQYADLDISRDDLWQRIQEYGPSCKGIVTDDYPITEEFDSLWEDAFRSALWAFRLSVPFWWEEDRGDILERIESYQNELTVYTRGDLLMALRDVIGNPFRPVTVDPSWLTTTVVTLAQQMYDSQDFTAMPILADALQDAGCGNEDVLTHCRSDGPHVRGCWVVDLILGKS